MQINDYRTDANLERQGKWVDFDDARFLIASNNNAAYRRVIARLARTKYQQALRKQDIAAQEKMTIDAMAETILLGWENVKDGDTELPYSIENARRLLEIPAIREFVAVESQNIANFQTRAEAADTDAIKSSPTVAPAVGGQA